MVYFDTDVPVNLLVEQDQVKHQFSRELYQNTVDQQRFFISKLCILETAFVLRKLGRNSSDIEAMIEVFLAYHPVSASDSEMRRCVGLAKLIGFQNISDCLHTAIAGTYCTELVTYNKSDFIRIQKHSGLKINTL